MLENINTKIVIFGFLGALMAVVAIVRMSYISIARGRNIREVVDDKAYSKVVVTAFGGNLLGDNGKDLLSYYHPNSEIRWNAKKAKKSLDDFSVDTLIHLFDKYYKAENNGKSYRKIFTDAYKNDKTYQLIMKDVLISDEKKIRTFPIFREAQGGLMVEKRDEMKFTSRKIGLRTLGKPNLDESENNHVGLIGRYGDTLKGSTLSLSMFHGSVVPVNIAEDIFPDDGRDIVTTINYDLSEYTYNVLSAQMRKVGAGKGCAMIMDVKTGDIKTMINLTRGDGNDSAYYEFTNIAYAHPYEPGSVFKLASYLVGLKDNLIDINKQINIGNGKMNFPGKVVTDSHTYSSEKIYPVHTLFAISSNVGAAKIIYDNYKNNPQKFVDGLHELHLDDHIKTDILSSAKSHIKNVEDEDWWNTSLYQMAQGYEVMITPINLLTFYNAVANDGVMMRPRYVTKIAGNKTKDEIVTKQVVVDTICSSAVAKTAQSLLAEVVTDGTAKEVFNGAPYTFAGKTGTAQIGAKHVYSATFAGFMPAENPKYTIFVMMTDLHDQYYAAQTAAPVVRKIADRIYATDKSFFKELVVKEPLYNKDAKKEITDK